MGSVTSRRYACLAVAVLCAPFAGGCGGQSKTSTAAAVDIPAPIPGTAAERKFKQALDCGFKTPGQGSLLLAEAEQKGFEIKAAAE
jgi:hypothetical protein